MKPVKPRNLAASIRQKLLNTATKQREDFGLVLTRYGLERLLYRLSQSRYCDQFVLKGAMLFQIWTNTLHRPTRDLDLLGYGNPSPERCLAVFRELCGLVVPDDGLDFPAEAISVEKIKEDQEYEGIRVRLLARMANIRIPLQVDVGFGDALPARPGVLNYPTLLPMPAAQIQVYPMEAVIAEKLEAMVHLGMLNSRMKDFFDIWFLARTFSFESSALADAIRITFERRGTQLDPRGFDALTAELSVDTSKLIQWQAFLNKGNLVAPESFAGVIGAILGFVSFPLHASIAETRRPASWPPGGPWLEANRKNLGSESPIGVPDQEVGKL
ncbi:MAG TPA: nucleotidyl transferase AbiEii/AbiGii toxin family protein [Bryobacteraceae bacterium]|nr:nucleotidyl transferase AbiEii/AbiGii toxin family protein [Bryobacteraceae bacterium]